jgi:EAL domain-containing protein (putative c-di-GMP-specific phosphodiesterase class I)
MLPVTSLKIERSFVMSMTDDADNMAIASTIISLAHSMERKVVAEGVEKEGQAAALAAAQMR